MSSAPRTYFLESTSPAPGIFASREAFGGAILAGSTSDGGAGGCASRGTAWFWGICCAAVSNLPGFWAAPPDTHNAATSADNIALLIIASESFADPSTLCSHLVYSI